GAPGVDRPGGIEECVPVPGARRAGEILRAARAKFFDGLGDDKSGASTEPDTVDGAAENAPGKTSDGIEEWQSFVICGGNGVETTDLRRGGAADGGLRGFDHAENLDGSEDHARQRRIDYAFPDR